MPQRKVFNYDCQTDSKMASPNEMYPHSVTACGCLFYKVKPLRLMLIKYKDPKWPRYDDCGGQIDAEDSSIQEAQIREVLEETNHQIPASELRARIEQATTVFYNPMSKYYLTLIKVDDDFYPDGKLFGDQEEHDKIIRSINWYQYTIVRDQLAMRLVKCSKLMSFLDTLGSVSPKTKCLL